LTIDFAQYGALASVQYPRMMALVDEQSRLRARIADFELRILQARENAHAGGGFMRTAEQDQVLQMLVRTLRALQARGAHLARQ
jgi:hypothetical protein